jgi:5-methyltetrahydrofolate--homocysteine methyltransferase
MDIKTILGNERLYLDGGMGSMIQKRIENPGPIPEELNLTHPEVIGEIQAAYVAAGADILVANTFGANGHKMAGSPYSVDEVVRAAVHIAKARHPRFVAMDIGPTGALIGDLGDLSFDAAKACFAEAVRAGAAAGADLIFIETMTDIYEARAAVLAAKEHCDLPIICSMTYEDNSRTLTGSDPETVVTILEGLGVDAIGINCSTGPDKMMPVIDRLLKAASVPIVVEPNAGLPRVVDGETVYDIDAAAFAGSMCEIAVKGAAVLGGCCGTTPDYIAATIARTRSVALPARGGARRPMRIASSTRTVTLGTDIRVIGEAINPTTNPELKADLRQGRMAVVKRLALEQKQQGADILDVNVGLPEVDEAALMVQAVHAISQVVDLPLQIDSTKPEVIEAVLKNYNGKPLVNSVNGEAASMAGILPIVAHYGAAVLGLTLDDDGIPATAAGRVAVADKLIAEAAKQGIGVEHIAIDCLVLTASAQQAGVRETLDAVRAVKAKYGVPTVLGVSNISFGLPNRRLINKTFLTMALSAGLDTPIMKAADAEMMNAVSAYRALAGLDDGCMAYVAAHKDDQNIEMAATGPGQTTDAQNEENGEAVSASGEADVIGMVVDGLKDEIVPVVQEMLTRMPPMDIVNNYLIPGLDKIGDLFETGEVFLPNLIFAAETVQNAFAEIKKAIKSDEQTVKGTVVLATVKGDVHDIGKNILRVIMENYGYRVVDLGKDVDPEVIVDAARREGAGLVGLSALMTTTVKNMEITIARLKAELPEVPVMVGGAVMNETYAQSIHADFYGKDARAGVAIADKVFGG